MSAILGVDPGNRGALAILDPETARMRVLDMPVFEYTTTRKRVRVDPYGVAAEIAAQPLAMAYLEEVHSSPQMGVTSAFTFGEGKGVLLGVLAALGIPLMQVKPQVWQKQMRCPKDPAAAVQRACQLFPDLAALFKGPRGGGIDGRAEAAIIALFGAMDASRSPTAPIRPWT